MYAESSLTGLTGIYDDLMENIRVRYVVTYRSTANDPRSAMRTARVELIDPTTGGPVTIVDKNGKIIRSKVVIENSYKPNASS